MPRLQTDFVTIASGSTVSGVFGIGNSWAAGLWAPEVTGCQLYIQVSYDTASANFKRVDYNDGQGNWAWNLGVGSRAVTIEGVAMPFSLCRLETSVAQTDTRTFAVFSRT
jgi:hypothetical protein